MTTIIPTLFCIIWWNWPEFKPRVGHKEVLLQKLMCLWFVKYTWLFVYQALCTVIICTTYFYIKHQMMRLLDEREILFWEYFEKLWHNCRKVEINFSLWFSWLVMYITRELNIVIWLEFLLKYPTLTNY